VREMLALLLESEGHHTTTAEDGRKALEFAMQGTIRPDLLVADYNLPKGLNGLQVVAELRRRSVTRSQPSFSAAISRPTHCARSPRAAICT
jgi:CheY-like chemotaxis protein